MIERCEKTDLLRDECAHCRGLDSAEEKQTEMRSRLLTNPRWFPAKYSGTCSTCGEDFEEGTAIRLDLGRGWRGECCREAQ